MRPLAAKSVALSVSHHLPHEEVANPNTGPSTRSGMTRPTEISRTAGKCNVEAIHRLLLLFPNATDLTLHWYNLASRGGRRQNQAEYKEQQFFESLATQTTMPLLQLCTLRGISTTGKVLLNFMRTHPYLRRMTMKVLWFGWFYGGSMMIVSI